MAMHRIAGWILMIAMSPALAGCEESARIAVSGNIWWQGKPLTKGSIIFVPTDGHDGPKVGSETVEGRYAISQQRGPTEGTYRVEVRADEGDYPHSPTDRRSTPMKSRSTAVKIPAEYNEKSKLRIVVSGTKEGEFDFDLPLK
jgi:hypothetical protein